MKVYAVKEEQCLIDDNDDYWWTWDCIDHIFETKEKAQKYIKECRKGYKLAKKEYLAEDEIHDFPGFNFNGHHFLCGYRYKLTIIEFEVE